MLMEDLNRIKFQWFCNNTAKMYEVISLDVEDGSAMVRLPCMADQYTPDVEVNLLDGVLRQSTGLEDKNSKLIYEGDILNVVHFIEDKKEIEWQRLARIYWNQSRVCFQLRGIKKDITKYGGSSGTLEVVGNIHQNPELPK